MLDRVFVLLLLYQKDADVVVHLEQRQPRRKLLQRGQRLLGLTQGVLRHPDVKLSFVVTRVLVVYKTQFLGGFFLLRRLGANLAELKYGGGVLILCLLVVFLDRPFKESDTRLAVTSER